MKAYKQYPALAHYIDRIAAEQLTFRSFMVKEYRHRSYYLEKCLIRIDHEGELTVTNKDFAPTKEEKEAIKKEFAGRTDFPKCVHASEAQLDRLIEQLSERGTPLIYEFWDWHRKGIVMVQQRVNKPDGDKMFLPWTMWSDGEWRMMEPDTGLPFWKPKKHDDNDGGHKIMVHEGAKTAAFVQDLVTNANRKAELLKHPYGEILVAYEHWGMIGGALAPHRTDYTELHREKPSEVVYVCDNDYPGNSALEKVSKLYGRALKGIQFGGGFPKSFDLADPMPSSLFTDLGKWKGPRWFELMRFATHGTQLAPNPAGSGRPLVTLSHDFAEEWYHVIKPEVFIHRDWPAEALTAQEFNHKVAAFADVDDMARLMKRDGATIAGNLAYNPAERPGLYPAAGGHYINTHVPSPIRAAGENADYSMFIKFLTYLIPDERERHELMKWCATLIARPDIKMLYGVLLISETQGIGKSTLGEKILAPLLGPGNVSYPSESEIVDSQYNYWAAHRRLAVVHEIYAGHSAKAYNKLKSLITDRTMTVSKKYMASYEVDNWVHVYACSNSTRAIQLSMDDRRWFVPKVTEVKQKEAFWQELNLWLNERGGLGCIKQWAIDFAAEHGHVLTGADAPWSLAKKEMVEDGYSLGMQLVAQTLTSIRNMLESEEPDHVRKREQLMASGYIKDGQIIMVDTDFVKLIRDVIYEGRHNDRLEKPLTIRKVAKGAGWFINETKLPFKRWGDKHFRGRIITNSPVLAKAKPDDIPAGLAVLPTEQFKLM